MVSSQTTTNSLVFLVDRTHECCGRWEDVVDKDENGLFRGELDPLSAYQYELPHVSCDGGIEVVSRQEQGMDPGTDLIT